MLFASLHRTRQFERLHVLSYQNEICCTARMNRYSADNEGGNVLLLTVRANSRSRSIRGRAPQIRMPSGAEEDGWNTNLFPRKTLVSFQPKKLMPAPTARRVIYTRAGSPPLTTANYNFTADSSTVLQVSAGSQMLFDLPSAPLVVTCKLLPVLYYSLKLHTQNCIELV